jgi:hypothetical protein
MILSRAQFEWKPIHEIPCLKITSVDNNNLCGRTNYFEFLIRNLEDESQSVKFSVRYYTYNTETQRSHLINKRVKKYYDIQKTGEAVHRMNNWDCKMTIRQRLGFEVNPEKKFGGQYYRVVKSYIGQKKVSVSTIQDVCIGEQKNGFHVTFYVRGSVPKLQTTPIICAVQKLLDNVIFEGVPSVVSLNSEEPKKKRIRPHPKKFIRTQLSRRAKRRKINYKDSESSDSEQSGEKSKDVKQSSESEQSEEKSKDGESSESEQSSDTERSDNKSSKGEPSVCINEQLDNGYNLLFFHDLYTAQELYQDKSWLNIGIMDEEMEIFLASI